MNRPWFYREAGKVEKIYLEGTCPVINFTTEIVLTNGKVIRGGKQSGAGNEGLIGITPDQDPDIKERLGGMQGELRQRAEALLRKLGERQLPTGDLRKALNKMADLKDLQAKGSETEIRQVKKEISDALRNAGTALVLSINAGQEKVKRRNDRLDKRLHDASPPQAVDGLLSDPPGTGRERKR